MQTHAALAYADLPEAELVSLAQAGQLDKARVTFAKMLTYANHLGLYSEEHGQRGEHLGNFPQAFTHLALISAAYDLDRRLSGAGWRA